MKISDKFEYCCTRRTHSFFHTFSIIFVSIQGGQEPNIVLLVLAIHMKTALKFSSIYIIHSF